MGGTKLVDPRSWLEREHLRRRLPITAALDGECTLVIWQMAIDIVRRYVPDRGATILDYCGGTGQLAHSYHYRRLHISDGNGAFLTQALQHDSYAQLFAETIYLDRPATFLQDADARYDCVLSLMSYAASQPVYEQMIRKSIKPGGYLISIDAQSHIAKNEHMAGVQWLLLEGARNDGVEVVEHKTHLQCIDMPGDSIHVIVARRSA